MSNLILELLCPNYEDYEKYGGPDCTLKHWPEMWEPEICAEVGVAEERKKMQNRLFVLARDSVRRTLRHFKRLDAEPSYITELARKALIQLAEEHGWKVKNYDDMQELLVSPIIRTSMGIYEHGNMDVNIEVLSNPKPEKNPVELILPYMTKRERIHFEGKQQFPDKDKKNVVAYALVELAAENDWQSRKGTYHNGYRETFRI